MTAAVATRTTTVEVLAPGVQTSVQDATGRTGLWGVGVPPSGAWDTRSLALANLAVGNDRSAAGLEWVVAGPTLRFADRRLVCLTGSVGEATLDGRPLRAGALGLTGPGSVLVVGATGEAGMRGYLAVSGGLDVPVDLGSRSTFMLGGIGGHQGRALQAGDVLAVRRPENGAGPLAVTDALPVLTDTWTLRVLAGPHGAPEHLTEAGVEELFATSWVVDHRSDRTGVRLLGPTPQWARTDGGQAGLHPSNIHDSAYPVGGIMLSGDTPVIVGPDGPSLGGFVVMAATIGADLWQIGQLRPGDRVVLQRVTPAEAAEADRVARAALEQVETRLRAGLATPLPAPRPSAPAAVPGAPAALLDVEVPAGLRVTVRHSGDRHLLVEVGENLLDLRVRVWVALLEEALRARGLRGIRELVPGVRNLLVGYDPDRLPTAVLVEALTEVVTGPLDPDGHVFACREVTLPIAFDHPLAHEAMQRYARGVRPDAPWCPDNVEFIRRVNDLDSRDEVFDIVRDATYLVLGLGDVYLGAPVAVPLDPRHRLVTTKYNPARTWTPQNAVGIGGVYLCVYGMEGPGGYQLVGRTVPVWRHLPDRPGLDEQPWLLRHFDRLRFRPVSAEELADLRADLEAGRTGLEVRPATFGLAEVDALQAEHGAEIAAVTARREAAFAAERERWAR